MSTKSKSSKRSKRKANSDSEDEFVVESVINKRRNKDGTIEYLLKWVGYSLEDSTWEPESNVSCPDLIAEFEKCHKKFNVAKPEEMKDKVMDKVIGITEAPGEPHFLIKWKDGTADLILCKEANLKYPQDVIAFYERNVNLK